MKFNSREFKTGDRAKIWIWEPPKKEWFAGTVAEIKPKRVSYPTSVFGLIYKGAKHINIIEQKNGKTMFEDPGHMEILVKTDKKVTEDKDALFDGFGVRCGHLGHIIFENEKEYDPLSRGTINSEESPNLGESPDLPF